MGAFGAARLDLGRGGLVRLLVGCFFPKSEKANLQPNQCSRNDGPNGPLTLLPQPPGPGQTTGATARGHLPTAFRPRPGAYVPGPSSRNTIGTRTQASWASPPRRGGENASFHGGERGRVEDARPARALERHIARRAVGAHQHAQRDRAFLAVPARRGGITRRRIAQVGGAEIGWRRAALPAQPPRPVPAPRRAPGPRPIVPLRPASRISGVGPVSAAPVATGSVAAGGGGAGARAIRGGGRAARSRRRRRGRRRRSRLRRRRRRRLEHDAQHLRRLERVLVHEPRPERKHRARAARRSPQRWP